MSKKEVFEGYLKEDYFADADYYFTWPVFVQEQEGLEDKNILKEFMANHKIERKAKVKITIEIIEE